MHFYARSHDNNQNLGMSSARVLKRITQTNDVLTTRDSRVKIEKKKLSRFSRITCRSVINIANRVRASNPHYPHRFIY